MLGRPPAASVTEGLESNLVTWKYSEESREITQATPMRKKKSYLVTKPNICLTLGGLCLFSTEEWANFITQADPTL